MTLMIVIEYNKIEGIMNKFFSEAVTKSMLDAQKNRTYGILFQDPHNIIVDT